MFQNFLYHIYHMYSDRQAWANSVDPDTTAEYVSLGSKLFPTHPAIFRHNIGQ